MPQDPNTDDPNTDNPTETKPLDTEDWEIALEPYTVHPGAALMLGFNFMLLKTYLTVEPLQIQAAIEGIDLGVAVLFQYTQFHQNAYEMFRKLVKGELTVEVG